MEALATVQQYKIFNKTNDMQKQSQTDEEILFYLKAASNIIRKYTSQNFTKSKITEAIYGNTDSFIIVNSPIISVNSFNVGGVDVSSEKYYFYDTNIVSKKNFGLNFLNQDLLIEYIGGYEEIPEDIVQACVYLASLRSKEKNSVDLVSVGNNGSTTSYDKSELPNWIRSVLDTYKNYTNNTYIVKTEEI